MYPANETYATLASVAFLQALTDANMLVPTTIGTTALFPAANYDIRLAGDESVVGSNRKITIPIAQTIIAIGRCYGREKGYADDTYVDMDLWIPFTVYANTMDTQDSVEQRLLFARDHRQNVFSTYGINIQREQVVGAKPRSNSPVSGLAVVDYRWKFWYSRT